MLVGGKTQSKRQIQHYVYMAKPVTNKLFLKNILVSDDVSQKKFFSKLYEKIKCMNFSFLNLLS